MSNNIIGVKKKSFDENIKHYYDFLNCRNRLLALAIVLTYYDSMENLVFE